LAVGVEEETLTPVSEIVPSAAMLNVKMPYRVQTVSVVVQSLIHSGVAMNVQTMFLLPFR
jgi:hypothetical protein